VLICCAADLRCLRELQESAAFALSDARPANISISDLHPHLYLPVDLWAGGRISDLMSARSHSSVRTCPGGCSPFCFWCMAFGVWR